MKNKAILLLLPGLIFGLAAGYLIFLSGKDNRPASQSPAQQAPSRGLPFAEFSLASLDDEVVRTSDLRGKAAIINFWATWCVPCQDEMPLLQNVADQYPDQLTVVGIDAGEGPDTVRAFLDQFGISFTILLDKDNQAQELYRVYGFPTTFFLDADGVLQAQHIGVLDEESMGKYLDQLGVDHD
ncbi:MAG: TlpA family protein disulfide reductase [Chloroflexi bacterium]|nr:TlpA family protein disulfide reductase [Chloroflexota bacterium]